MAAVLRAMSREWIKPATLEAACGVGAQSARSQRTVEEAALVGNPSVGLYKFVVKS
jgi:hypothetical protein